jgi:hypothetical protein
MGGSASRIIEFLRPFRIEGFAQDQDASTNSGLRVELDSLTVRQSYRTITIYAASGSRPAGASIRRARRLRSRKVNGMVLGPPLLTPNRS